MSHLNSRPSHKDTDARVGNITPLQSNESLDMSHILT